MGHDDQTTPQDKEPKPFELISRRRFLIYLGLFFGSIMAGLSLLRTFGVKTVNRFRINSIEPTQLFDPDTWTLTIDGLVDTLLEISYDELKKLKSEEQISDFHCVEGWSVEDVRYRGIRMKTLFDMVDLRRDARFVTFHSASSQYKDSLSIEEAMEPEVMLAYEIYGKPLSAEQGRPLRLVMPRMWGYKNVKWVDRITFTRSQEVGYWELRGYNIDGVSY